MSFHSLNDFVYFLEERRQLKRISQPLHPKFEIATLADSLLKSEGPALLLEKVIGSEFPLLINIFGSEKRTSWALGVENLEELATTAALFQSSSPLPRFWERGKSNFHPKPVGFGPSQQVIQNRPDWRLLPILQSWEKESGPSLWLGLTLTQNWERKEFGLERNRIFLLDEKTAAVELGPQSRCATHFAEFRARGMKMPVAIVLGGDPILTWIAGLPPQLCEKNPFHFAGFLRKKEIPLVKGITQNLPIPAEADFILEGYFDPKEPLVELGSYADRNGCYGTPERSVKFHLTGITHRQYPVFPAAIPATVPNEFSFLGLATERLLLLFLKKLFPEIVELHLPAAGSFQNLALVSIRKKYPGHGRKIMHSLWGTEALMFQRCLVVLDHDVELRNAFEIVRHVTANIDARRDMVFSEGPIARESLGSAQPVVGVRCGIDATRKRPEEQPQHPWPEEVVPETAARKKIDALLAALGHTSPAP